MNKTTENLLTWGALGAGIALLVTGHRRWGAAVAMIAPVTVTIQHPRGTAKALKSVPVSFKVAGESVGKGFAAAGKGLKWMAS